MVRVRRVFATIAVMVVIAILGAAQEASAQLQIRLEQVGFPALTILDNGPGDFDPSIGSISFSGSYGTFGLSSASAASKPQLGDGSTFSELSDTSFDLTGSGGDLVITVIDTGFTFPGNPITLLHSVGGTLNGNASLSFQSWANSNNLFPAAGLPAAIPPGSVGVGLGPFSSSPFGGNNSTNFTRGAGPYSLFSQSIISFAGPGFMSFGQTIDAEGQAPCTGAIGDFVWNDLNHDGVQDAGELGIPNITVELRDSANALLQTTTTDSNGLYHFTGLCSDNYKVVVPPQPNLAGYTPSPTLTTTPDKDSNPNPFSVFLPPNTVDNTVDFGFYLPFPHLTVVKTPKAGTFTQGSPVTFTIVVGNDGGSTANNVVLNDQLPGNGGLQWTGFTTTQGNCTISLSNQLSCSLGNIPAAGSVTIQVTSNLTTPDAACQLQPNPLAKATADGGLQAQDFGSLTCTPPIHPATTLITQSVSPNTTVVTGTPVTITVTEKNTGDTPITAVSVTGTGCLGWAPASVATLAVGQSADFTCTFTANATTSWTATGHGTDLLGNPVPLTGETTGGTITVVSPPTATCVLINAVQGVAITPVTMTGSGGAGGPYTFSATGLPTGLTMSTTGTISGTPTVSGTFPYTVTVTDKNGNTGTLNCSVTVNPPPTATCIVINAVQGVAITPVTMTGSGGAGGPYTFSATGLPTGLTMSTTGTISGTPTVSGTFPYTVTVTDKNGNTGTLNCSVTVNPPPTATCIVINAVQGVAITPVTMTGSGGAGGPYTFSATGLPTGLTMSSGGTISGTPTVSGTFPYTVTVTDKNGNTGTLNCSVTVNPPPTATCIVINAVQGVAITPVTMTGSGGAGGPYTFSATGLPTGLTMSTTGTISGTPTVSGTFPYTVTVTDKNGNTGTLNCSVTVNPPPTATCIVINAVKGVAITPVTMTGSGGAGGPYTFSATGLPTGLTMSTTGTISGTPTVTGTFPYTVTITDKNGNTGTLNCSVTVNPPPTATCIVINAVQGVAITPVTMTGSGGAGGPYTFSATGLPTGLTMSTTGTISGTPTVTGTFPYTVTITDKNGNTGTLNCSVTVVPPLVPACVSLALGQVGIPYSSAITATGGTAPYTFALFSGTLPTGLTLNTATGVISGTPTVAGPFSFSVKVTDSTGITHLVSTTPNCGITILPPPPPLTAACAADISGAVGVPYSSQIIASGGTTPYTFALASGALPGGLTLNSATGVISGTPTTAGTFSFTVKVTDSTGATHLVYTTPGCGITITPPGPCVEATFAFTGDTPSSGTFGNSRTFTVNGVSVKATAFSRTTAGAWSTAYLGLYGPGLGVTDNSEGDGANPKHKVDNIGQVNYVMFEFSSAVVVDRVFLDAIGSDSDMSVWIGTKTDPFHNHLTLSDSLLTSLGPVEENLTSATVTSRWADINSGAVSGNVLVIAALASDTTAEDEFKISKLDISCAPPPPTCTGAIGNFVWKDINNNGIQDSGEPGIAGIAVQLKNSTGGTLLASTTTDSTGYYQFTGLCAGTYTVFIPTPPSGYSASPSQIGTNRSIDSNGSGTTVTLPANNSTDQTIDFGFVPPVTPPCVASTFAFSGNTATYGTFGNVRTFTVNGVSVNATAFSRSTAGAWSTAYLGMYAPGLGVTDNSEGTGPDPKHKVDNIGQVNYVMFEFSSAVTLNRVFLDAIGADSDMSVWIGTKTNPFANHVTLSDSVLTSLGAVEESLTSATVTSRWADVNSGNKSGNVIVIAALASDTTPDDEFKISKLDLSCATPPPTCSGSIGDFVWKDTNGNGIQDFGEPGIPSVTVQLKSGTTVIASTTTNASGYYQFTGLCAGSYTVVISTPPSGYTASPSNVGTNRSTDSNGSGAAVTLTSNSSDQTIDFGYVPPVPPVCGQTTFQFTGNSALTGTLGNSRTFTVNGISVKVTAFSRTTGGVWSKSYLGLYGPGLGVTNNTENGVAPTHKVDNIGQVDYVMFEFSGPVVINQAFLDAIGQDGDISVWIGTKTDPFNNHQTLSDSLLVSLGSVEENLTSLTATSRWADINASNKAGNVIVISPLATDTTPEDEFKISKLDVKCQ